MVEAVGIEPTSLEPFAQIYYKLSRCYLLAWHVTDKRPTRGCKGYNTFILGSLTCSSFLLAIVALAP